MKKIEEIKENHKNNPKRQSHQKMFFFKQLADVVESVTGAVTVACGLNLTQNYLKKIEVLKFTQGDLLEKLLALKKRKESNTEAKLFRDQKTQENNGYMLEVEQKINYEFKNKLWLVEALTHKSYIDQKQPQGLNVSKLNKTVDKTISSIHEMRQGFGVQDVTHIDEVLN